MRRRPAGPPGCRPFGEDRPGAVGHRHVGAGGQRQPRQQPVDRSQIEGRKHEGLRPAGVVKQGQREGNRGHALQAPELEIAHREAAALKCALDVGPIVEPQSLWCRQRPAEHFARRQQCPHHGHVRLTGRQPPRGPLTTGTIESRDGRMGGEAVEQAPGHVHQTLLLGRGQLGGLIDRQALIRPYVFALQTQGVHQRHESRARSQEHQSDDAHTQTDWPHESGRHPTWGHGCSPHAVSNMAPVGQQDLSRTII